jgi:hypothetical protein
MADCVVLNTIQRRKMILGKAFNMQHELFDIIFKDSFDNGFNNFINLYEKNKNFHDDEKILYEVDSQYREKVYLQWMHGRRTEGYAEGMRYPAYISYVKGPTKEKEPHKIVDVDLKNLRNFVDTKTLDEYEKMLKKIEDANLKAKLVPVSSVSDFHDVVDRIGALLRDELGRYSWVGGVFWGGKGFSYWGDWNSTLMDNLAAAGLVDELTNTGQEGYHAQRLCSPQLYKPSMANNYHCGGSYDAFKYSCPAFFMLSGEKIIRLLDNYHKMNFVTSFKANLDLEDIMRWQDAGEQDLKIWEAWRRHLKNLEDEIRSLVFISEKK